MGPGAAFGGDGGAGEGADPDGGDDGCWVLTTEAEADAAMPGARAGTGVGVGAGAGECGDAVLLPAPLPPAL